MFSKSIISTVLVLGLSMQAYGHAAVAPALGVTGNLVRNNVQRPSTANPCGNVNIASTIDKSTAVPVAADGTFPLTATNFNAGADGSRSFSAQVDAAGTGKKFVAAKVTKNGDAAPKNVGSDALVAALPAGTKCTGGASKNKCLVSLKSTAGFGNCVVVQQGGAATKPAKKARAGTLAARALLESIAELEARGEEALEILKRESNWVWA